MMAIYYFGVKEKPLRRLDNTRDGTLKGRSQKMIEDNQRMQVEWKWKLDGKFDGKRNRDNHMQVSVIPLLSHSL